MRTTPRRGGPVLAGALLVLLGVLPARATEPACPAGEITLSAHLLAITRAGAGADRLVTPSSSFVLPAGVSFGGHSYSSALGTSVAIAALQGAFDLVGGAPGLDGVAPVAMSGPVYYTGPILGGAFGTLCFRVTSCTGIVDCVGATAVGVQLVQDSAGPGLQNNPVVATTGLGGPGGPGAVLLTCQQSFVQLPPGPADCTTAPYPPDQTAYYTTGQVEGHFLNGNPRIGTGEISVTGQDFSCAAWAMEDGPGELATGFLVEEDPQAGDSANANLLVD